MAASPHTTPSYELGYRRQREDLGAVLEGCVPAFPCLASESRDLTSRGSHVSGHGLEELPSFRRQTEFLSISKTSLALGIHDGPHVHGLFDFEKI